MLFWYVPLNWTEAVTWYVLGLATGAYLATLLPIMPRRRHRHHYRKEV